MKILMIINGALEHRPFYLAVGRRLEAQGARVTYVLDSHYTDFVHPEARFEPTEHVHYFSDYLREHFDRTEQPPEMKSVNVWSAMFPDTDRMMFSRFVRRPGTTYYESVLANLGWFFAGLFDQYDFDSIVYENVSNAFSYVAYHIAQKRGAKFVGFTPSRMPGRLDILDVAPSGNTRMKPLFTEIRKGAFKVPLEVDAFVSEYLRNVTQKVPEYMLQKQPFEMGPLERYSNKKSFQRFSRSVRYITTERDDYFYAFQVADPRLAFPEQLLKETWRYTKIKLLHKTYQTQLDLNRAYFVYPLQFHPESASSVDGPSWNDEWHNIEQIARTLPFGIQLYVKDHRHAEGKQPLHFYNKVARLPNVTLVSAHFNTKELLRRCKAVVCSTSTMGFESLIMQKPTFVLGEPFYAFLPGCVRVTSFNEAFEQFSKVDEITIDRRDVEAFLAAYYLCTEAGTLDMRKDFDDPDAIARIASIVAQQTASHTSRREGGRARHQESRMV